MSKSGLDDQEWDSEQYKHQELTRAIIASFYDVYNELGHGFLESIYERAITIALRTHGIALQQQLPLPVWFRGERIGDFRADLVIANAVIVEIKACRLLESCHEAQLLNYLRSSDIEVGLLLNFGPKPQIKRLVFADEKKKNLCPSALTCV